MNYISVLCGLDEVDLQELLEVQVSNLSLVIHAEQLGEHCVGEDTTLEGGVIATVGLDILTDELGHLSLRTLLGCLDTHEGSQLRTERLLLQEGIVRPPCLPQYPLLGGESGRIYLALLL